jgi:hypothetical protein
MNGAFFLRLGLGIFVGFGRCGWWFAMVPNNLEEALYHMSRSNKNIMKK